MFSGEREFILLTRVVSIAIVLVFCGSMATLTKAAIDFLFPEPAPAVSPERIVLCGRMGTYRIYCGVGDDFTGPTEDPVRQWK